MEKLNIAEILKDCKRGTELYSPIFGKVYLDKIRPHLAIVVTTDKEQGNSKEEFLYDGRYRMNGECMLFPSKDKTTWDGFQRPFNDGDILVHTQNDRLVISIYHNKITELIIKTHCILWDRDEGLSVNSEICCYANYVRFATEEEKQKLFDTIKDNGYRWDQETKTLKKLVKHNFKEGDRIKSKYYTEERTISICREDGYWTTVNSWIKISDQDKWELVPNKFDINSLKPFESKVLVRNEYKVLTNEDYWRAAVYGGFIKDAYRPFHVIGGNFFKYCIPYEGNEHLLNKKEDCNEYFKSWK